MTYADFFSEFKQKFDGTDVSDITEHLAYQFNIEDDQAGGAFYVEVKEGELHIEPYEYYDRDAAFICKPETLNKIISGELDPVEAFSKRELRVDGNLDKALRLKELVEKKRQGEEKKKAEEEAQKKEEARQEEAKREQAKQEEIKKEQAKQEEIKKEQAKQETKQEETDKEQVKQEEEKKLGVKSAAKTKKK